MLIAINELSLEKFACDVPREGLILYNGKNLPAGFTQPQARVLALPAVDIADKLGSAKAGNMVMLARCWRPSAASRPGPRAKRSNTR